MSLKKHSFIRKFAKAFIIGLCIIPALIGCSSIEKPSGRPAPSWVELISDLQEMLQPIAIGISILCLFLVFANICIRIRGEREDNKSEKAKRLKEKYRNFSVVGVFLDRFKASHVIAQNMLAVSQIIYIAVASLTPLPIRWEILGVSTFFLLMLWADNFITQHRIKHGYYLSNEAESRELIKFIQNNSSDIDFTGGDRKILSKKDLEEVVLGQVGYNPV